MTDQQFLAGMWQKAQELEKTQMELEAVKRKSRRLTARHYALITIMAAVLLSAFAALVSSHDFARVWPHAILVILPFSALATDMATAGAGQARARK